MVGDVLNRHVLQQVEGIACKDMGVVLLGVGEVDLHLAGFIAVVAEDARHLEVDEGGSAANRRGVKGAFDAALGPDVGGAAQGAAEAFAWLLDAKGGQAGLEGLADIVVADDAEAVIQ